MPGPKTSKICKLCGGIKEKYIKMKHPELKLSKAELNALEQSKALMASAEKLYGKNKKN